MSLKAKIEAVIYASEEPVTLAQLMGLLGVEAQAELDALETQQTILALEVGETTPESEAGDQDALNAETLGEAEAATDTEGATSEPELPQEPARESASTSSDTDQAEAQLVNKGSAPESPEQNARTASVRELAAESKTRERKLREYFRSLLDRLVEEYANGDRGLEIREIAGGFRLATKPEYHDAVRGFVRSLKPPLKLSLQALETLAVVAYKQPVTAPEVSEVRGVDSGGVLGSLMTRKLITTAGRKQVIGRPILYKTTKEFLVRFGLKDINELPSIEEFEKMASEFTESEPVQEEIAMEAPYSNRSEETIGTGHSGAVSEVNAAPETTHVMRSEENVEPNADVHEPQADGDDRPVDVADDVIVDGRISGIPPHNASGDNPSAKEALEQETEGT